jgi:hypothetical protein
MGRERRGCVREGERNYVPTQTYRSFPLAGLRQVKDKMGNMSITVFKVKTHRVSFLKRGTPPFANRPTDCSYPGGLFPSLVRSPC